VADEDELSAEIRALRTEVTRLNGHAYLRVQNSMPRMLAWTFARGLALGLGTVVGASILVSAVAFSLRGIDFLPVIGDWAAEIAREIEADR